VFNGHDRKNKITIRLKAGVDVPGALAKTRAIYTRHSPSYPFDYQFVDDDYNKKFAAEVGVGHLANAFAGLAIFISCLGLFGLAAYTAERRTKEIGIRKILGASLRTWWACCRGNILGWWPSRCSSLRRWRGISWKTGSATTRTAPPSTGGYLPWPARLR
jgi:hypothetical protein